VTLTVEAVRKRLRKIEELRAEADRLETRLNAELGGASPETPAAPEEPKRKRGEKRDAVLAFVGGKAAGTRFTLKELETGAGVGDIGSTLKALVKKGVAEKSGRDSYFFASQTPTAAPPPPVTHA
jgi:hypothetical protein